MPNRMEELIGDDPQTPPAGDKKPEPNPELDSLKESVNTLGDNLQSLNEKLSGIEEKLTVATPPAEETGEEPPYTGPAGQPRDWKEVRETARKDAEEVAEEKLRAKEEEAEARYAEEEKERGAINEAFNKQIEEMEKDNLIQPIKDMDDPEDPGKVERREIFGYAGYRLKSTDLKAAKEALDQYHKNGMAFDPKSNKFIRTRTSSPGQTVPVGSSSSRGASGKSPIDYKTLHAHSIDSLIQMSQE